MVYFEMIMKQKIFTFSGADGAGKTTILNEIRRILEDDFNLKVVELRQRPSILPILSSIKYGKKIAEKKTMEVLPRSGKNSSKLSSYIRFFYYLSDYIFGQWIFYFSDASKGDIVLYDRYYFDYIADPKRANIIINKTVAKFFYKFIIKPDVNIFLYASPEVILRRKQELDFDSIVDLTSNYKDLFCEMEKNKNGKYICIENINKEATIRKIIDILEERGI